MSTREVPSEPEDPHHPQDQPPTKRQKQSQISAFFTPATGASTDVDPEQLLEDEEEEENHDEKVALANVEIVAIIYAYCEGATNIPTGDPPWYNAVLHGKPVYVGQTIQDLLARDSGHFSANKTKFDRQYTNQSQYILVILDQRRFAPAANDSAFVDDTLRPASEWMDVRERKYISEFNTYLNGLNSTNGGQGGWLVAIREAIAKQSYLRFRNEYMPAFRAYRKDHPDVNAPWTHPIVGHLATRIRSGGVSIPIQFKEEIAAMGFDMNNQYIAQHNARWADKYMPAFRAYRKDHPDVNAPRTHPILGTLIHTIRRNASRGATSIPVQFEEELITMGLDLRNQVIVQRDARWADTYMPAFRAYRKDHIDVNVPQSHPILGSLISTIRTGSSSIPAQHEEELIEMGLDIRNQRIVQRDALWSDEYMPDFRLFHNDKGHINVSQHTSKLGALMKRIRIRESSIPTQHEEELRGMCMFWCTQNLARHVVRMLGRPVVLLESDAEAIAAVTQVAEQHARMRVAREKLTGRTVLEAAGLKRLPFGLKPLGDGVARFNADLARM